MLFSPNTTKKLTLNGKFLLLFLFLSFAIDHLQIITKYSPNSGLCRIEIEAPDNKRHKWDGLMNTTNKLTATVMLIEFVGGFSYEKDTKCLTDTKKIYRNALRILNSDNSCACLDHPRIFTVLTVNNRFFFESLTQVNDKIYVRNLF